MPWISRLPRYRHEVLRYRVGSNEGGADQVTATPEYVDAVLHGSHGTQPPVAAESFWHLPSLGLGLLAALLGTAFALAGLWPSRRPSVVVAALTGQRMRDR